MKKVLLFILLVITLVACSQESHTTFILVRHAEKASDGTKDPALTTEGELRAEEFKSLFMDSKISAIYSTNFKRTRSTVEPLAEAMGLKIALYAWQNQESMLSKMMDDYPNGTVVISGHSNTTPTLANILLGEERFEQFDDSDYSNILVIEAGEVGKGKLVEHINY